MMHISYLGRSEKNRQKTGKSSLYFICKNASYTTETNISNDFISFTVTQEAINIMYHYTMKLLLPSVLSLNDRK